MKQVIVAFFNYQFDSLKGNYIIYFVKMFTDYKELIISIYFQGVFEIQSGIQIDESTKFYWNKLKIFDWNSGLVQTLFQFKTSVS